MQLYTLVAGVLMATASHADGVLIQELPAGVEPAAVLSIVQHALIKRQWTVDNRSDDSITGSLKHNAIDAKLKLVIDGNTLRYEESATTSRPKQHGPIASHVGGKRDTNVPERWVAYLRADVSRLLTETAIASAASSKNSSRPASDPVQRMEKLDALRGSGLITEEEYGKKREEILDGI